jgi:hypothetical protein
MSLPFDSTYARQPSEIERLRALLTQQEVTIGRLLGCQEALTKLAGLCIADHEAVERGFAQYAGELEDAIRSRANLAQRLLADLKIEQPRSPYAR